MKRREQADGERALRRHSPPFGTDTAWFDSALPPEHDVPRAQRARARLVPLVLVSLLGVIYLVASFTLAGSLLGLLGWGTPIMVAGASLTLLLPLAIWHWLRRRFYRPRLMVVIALVNALFVIPVLLAAPLSVSSALEARGDWWVAGTARMVGAGGSGIVRKTTWVMSRVALALRSPHSHSSR